MSAGGRILDMNPTQLANMVLREGPDIHPASLVNKAAEFLQAERNGDATASAAEETFMAEYKKLRAARGKREARVDDVVRAMDPKRKVVPIP